MAARQLGPRLYLRRYSDRPSTWIIRDGQRQIYTRASEDRRDLAEDALRAYIAERYEGRPPVATAETMRLYPRIRAACVYFITCDEPNFPIKIGFTTDLAGRVRNLQIALPFDVVVLTTIPGTPATEGDLKALFAHLRTRGPRGEWFRRAPELIEYVKQWQPHLDGTRIEQVA